MKHAFSLVELSIVLVILGLLTGGILAGQALIRAAEIRSVSTEYARFTAAANSFRDKYFGYPGDIGNATKFWGQSANCPGTSVQGTTDGSTCDGNADGLIWYTGASVTTPTASEPMRFWQQLASAGLIEGSYSGVTSATNNYFAAPNATNAPKSKLSNGFWQAWHMPNATGAQSAAIFAGTISPFGLLVGGLTANNWNGTPIMRAEEAWNIDLKMDDGKPGRGKITSRATANCSNATANTQLDTDYNLTDTGLNCFLFISAN